MRVLLERDCHVEGNDRVVVVALSPQNYSEIMVRQRSGDGARANLDSAALTVALAVHPPAGGWSSLRWQFIVGILLAACGAMMVTFYKPAPGPAKAAQPAIERPSGR